MPEVLVTGGTGFVAGHCITKLLHQGYDVITTVRSDEKGDKLVKALSPHAKGKLSYAVVKDVGQKGAFDEVVKSNPDLDFVLHTASPFHYNIQDPVKDFLEPAVVGTTSILEAIKGHNSSVKRVVVTSSFAAINNGSSAKPPLYDESSWNPITWDQAVSDTKKTYQGSKTFAEKAAWEFVEKQKPSFDLVTINPTLVFGPAAPHLGPGDAGSLNTSNVRILDMIEGKMKDKVAPTGFYGWVDVRDVAVAHVNAMEAPAASGKRFYIINGLFTNKEIAHVIAGMGSEFRENLPADIDASEDDVPPPAERYRFNNKQSIDILSVKYTPFETCIKDTVNSLLTLRS